MAQFTSDGKRIVDLDGPKQGRLFSYGKTSANGKGDAPRPMDKRAFDTNFNNIDWNDGSKEQGK